MRAALCILQALNPSYAEHSPAASIDRGVLNSTTWGRSPGKRQFQHKLIGQPSLRREQNGYGIRIFSTKGGL